MRYLVALALLIAGACGNGGPDVHPAIVDMVDTLRVDGDCAGLQSAFDRTDDVDELRYIDEALDAAGCYG